MKIHIYVELYHGIFFSIPCIHDTFCISVQKENRLDCFSCQDSFKCKKLCMGQTRLIWREPTNRVWQLEEVACFRTWAVIHSAALTFWRKKSLNMKLWFFQVLLSSVISQKFRISKRVFQEKKARQIFRKTNISYPLIRTRTCAHQRLRNCGFSENLACFVFLKHPFWDSPLFVITDVVL